MHCGVMISCGKHNAMTIRLGNNTEPQYHECLKQQNATRLHRRVTVANTSCSVSAMSETTYHEGKARFYLRRCPWLNLALCQKPRVKANSWRRKELAKNTESSMKQISRIPINAEKSTNLRLCCVYQKGSTVLSPNTPAAKINKRSESSFPEIK